MKLKDLKELRFAVTEMNNAGFKAGDIVYRIDDSVCSLINFSNKRGLYSVSGYSQMEVRPLTSADDVEIDAKGILRLKQPTTEGVHLSELKVGQLGMVVSDNSDFCRVGSIVLRQTRDIIMDMKDGIIGNITPDVTVRVQPYHMGSKIIPQPDGSIVVEEAKPEGVDFDDLEQGVFFVDNNGDLGIKTNSEECCVTWLIDVNSCAGESLPESSVKNPVRRLTNAEAAAIIANY